MALVFNGTKVVVKAADLPSGYAPPAVTTFTDAEYVSDLSLDVLKSTVQNADKDTTVDNIVANGTIGIDKQLTDILNSDYDVAGSTITAYALLTAIDTNMNDGTNGVLYTDGVTNYVCTVKLYVKTA